jgi:hypothetical protein
VTPVPGCRFGDRCALDTYEQAVDCVGSHSEITRTEIAKRVAQLQPGRSEAYLRSCLSPHDGSHALQLAIAPVFTLASGNPALLQWHAKTAGYGIHRLADGTQTREEALLSLRDVLDAQQDVTRAVITGASDHRFTAAEATEITRRIHRAISELMELSAAVNLEAEPAR